MLSSFKKIYNFLFQSNLFIAFGATCLALQTQIELNMQLQWHPYLLLIFCAGFLGYNFYRLFVLFTHPNIILNHSKYEWLKANLRWFYVVTILVILGGLITSFFAKKTVLLLLFPLGILTLLYALPLFKVKQKFFSIREFSVIKIFIIAFVWAASTVLPPVIQSEQVFKISSIFLLMGERFIFILAITIPFDIRDMINDKQTGLKTVPLIIGEKNAWILSNILLLVFLILSFLYNFFNHSLYIFCGLFLSVIVTLISINNKKIRRWSNYYYGILDGMIIVQALLVILSRYLF